MNLLMCSDSGMMWLIVSIDWIEPGKNIRVPGETTPNAQHTITWIEGFDFLASINCTWYRWLHPWGYEMLQLSLTWTPPPESPITQTTTCETWWYNLRSIWVHASTGQQQNRYQRQLDSAWLTIHHFCVQECQHVEKHLSKCTALLCVHQWRVPRLPHD